jgi:hypothetical protein
MVLWISAVRRCAVSAPGRPVAVVSESKNDESKDVNDLSENSSAASVVQDVMRQDPDSENSPAMVRIWRKNVRFSSIKPWCNPEAEMGLIEFLKRNSSCAECNDMLNLKYADKSKYYVFNILLCS